MQTVQDPHLKYEKKVGWKQQQNETTMSQLYTLLTVLLKGLGVTRGRIKGWKTGAYDKKSESETMNGEDRYLEIS